MNVRFLLLPVLLAAFVAGCGGGGGKASLGENDIATVGSLVPAFARPSAAAREASCSGVNAPSFREKHDRTSRCTNDADIGYRDLRKR